MHICLCPDQARKGLIGCIFGCFGSLDVPMQGPGNKSSSLQASQSDATCRQAPPAGLDTHSTSSSALNAVKYACSRMSQPLRCSHLKVLMNRNG